MQKVKAKASLSIGSMALFFVFTEDTKKEKAKTSLMEKPLETFYFCTRRKTNVLR